MKVYFLRSSFETSRENFVVFTGEVSDDQSVVKAACSDCDSKLLSSYGSRSVKCSRCGATFVWHATSFESIEFKVDDGVVTLTCDGYEMRKGVAFYAGGGRVASETVPYATRSGMNEICDSIIEEVG